MTRKWRIVGAAVAFAAVAATAGVAVAQYERSDIDGLAPFLANDTCPQAFDLSGTGFRAYSTTQTARHDNNQPLSFGPDVYFSVPVSNGQQIVVSVQAPWRPSLSLGLSCSGDDNGALQMNAYGGSTLLWQNTTGGDVVARVMLAGNRVVDFGRYFIQADLAPLNKSDEVGIAVEAAAEHFLPHRTTWTFIEGTTRAGFVEILTLLSDVSQPITIEYFDERGPQPQQTCTLPARTRVTIRVNADPGPSSDGVCRDGFYGDGAGHDVSVRLMGTDEFRAERVVYHQPGVVSGSSASSASTGDHD